MPDYPTNVPAAGWYTDPSNPGQERWWGGVEWTHDVRPLTAPAPTPPLVLANVPGGGVNPFAALDAHEATLSGGGGFGGAPHPSSASDFSAFNSSFGAGATPDGQGSFGATSVNPSWYDADRRAHAPADPSNGFATAGLVLSLLGANMLGIIFSVLGLRKAREFELDGDLPVGRKRARWGLGLGIASFIISLALIGVYLFAFQYITSLYLQQTGGVGVQTEDSGGFTLNTDAPPVATDPANDGTYLRADYEQAIRDEYAEDGKTAPDSVVCPDAGATSEGSTIVCEITTGDLVETRTAQYFANGGYSISTTSVSG